MRRIKSVSEFRSALKRCKTLGQVSALVSAEGGASHFGSSSLANFLKDPNLGIRMQRKVIHAIGRVGGRSVSSARDGTNALRQYVEKYPNLDSLTRKIVLAAYRSIADCGSEGTSARADFLEILDTSAALRRLNVDSRAVLERLSANLSNLAANFRQLTEEVDTVRTQRVVSQQAVQRIKDRLTSAVKIAESLRLLEKKQVV